MPPDAEMYCQVYRLTLYIILRTFVPQQTPHSPRINMKKIAIVQSNYIPWKGYFDMIKLVDEFVLFDDMQYTRRDWRNRNKIKTANGLQWLTVPVEVKGKYFQKINETLISEARWAKDHWNTITHAYGKTKFFKEYKEPFESFYMNCTEKYLSKVNFELIQIINNILKIDTPIRWSSDFQMAEGKTERLLDLTLQCGGTEYISGPAAKDYISEEMFADAGVKLTWMDYSGYNEYPQLHPPFEHGVTVLDLIFNTGPEAVNYLKY